MSRLNYHHLYYFLAGSQEPQSDGSGRHLAHLSVGLVGADQTAGAELGCGVIYSPRDVSWC